MPRPLEWVQQASVDQQEEPLLLHVSTPSSPNTTSAHVSHSTPHSDATQHQQSDVRQCQPSPLTLPPAALSPSNTRPGSPTSSSSVSTKSHSCCRPLPLLVHFVLLWLVLASIHYLALHFQQTQLRCTVLAASHLLSQTSSPANWWWDFGTLLGLTREHDMIYTEVDADLSVTWQQRNRIWQQWSAADGNTQRTWQQYGFVHMELRGDPAVVTDAKLRLYDIWGWFLDIDVWDEVASNSSQWRFPSSPSPDRSQADPAVSMQMITGRLEPQQYVLPSALIYPLASQPPPSHWMSVCPHVAALLPAVPMVQVPHSVVGVLEHWYGSGWQEPRKFDKGRDRSNDWFEVWMWQKAVRVYELLWSAKVIARITVNGLQYHTFLLIYYTTTVSIASIAIMRAGYDWQRRQAADERTAIGASPISTVWPRWYRMDVWLALSPVLCTIAYVCVLLVLLFKVEYDWYVQLGWGMWRGLLVGLALPLVAFHISASKAASSSARAHLRSSSKQSDLV